MSTEERKSVIKVVAEDGTKEAFNEIKQGAKDTAQVVSKAGVDAAKGIGQIGEGVEKTSRKLEAFEKSWVRDIQRVLVATEAGEKGTAKYFETWGRFRGIGGDVLEPVIAQLKAAEAAQEAASASMGRMGMSAKATAAALRGVPAQFTDIIVSLQGGMNPLTVFLQQGGQLKDTFGGAGAAAKALGGYVLGLVNPFSVAAAGAAALAFAYHQGSQENDAFVRSIALTGNASGVTTNQLREYARQMSAVAGTQSQAASGLADFVAAGVRGGDEMRRYTQTAVEWEKVTGQAVSKTADQFASLQKDPLAAVLKLNEGANFLTVSVYEQIKALQEQGRNADASRVAMDTLDGAMRDRAKTIKESLGYIEAGWAAIKRVAAGAWDSMLNVGRQATVADQLADVRRQLAVEQRRLDGAERSSFGGSRETKAQELRIRGTVEALKAQETQLIANMQAEEKAAAAKAEGNRVMQARAEFDKKYEKALEGEITLSQKLEAARREAVAAGKNEADIKTVLAWVTEEHNKANKAGAKAAKAHNKELEDQKKLMAELAGLSPTFYSDWDKLTKMYRQGGMSLADLEKEQAKLLAKQPAMVALAKEEEKVSEARVKAWNDEVKAQEKLLEERQRAAAQVEETLKKAKDEEEAHILAAAAGITHAEALAKIALARAEDSYQQALAKGADAETLLALQKEIEARKELQQVMQQKGVREANKKAADEAAKDWDRTAQTISRTLSDYIMAGGKNAAQYLKDYFRTLVLRPVIQALVQPVAGSIASTVTSAMGMGSSGGASSLGSLGSSLLFKDFGGGLSDSVGMLGSKLFNTRLEGFGDSLIDFSGTLKQYSGVINTAGSVLSYGKALLDIGDGKYGSGIGTAVGQYFGGPIGATIGNLLGGALDKALGSRGLNHSGAAASSLGTGNTAAAQKLMGDSRGDWYTDLTDRYNAGLDKQLSGTVSALAGVYEKLSGYAGDAARSIELVGGFAVNSKYGDEGAVGYGQLWDRVSGQYLGGFSNRDLGTDQQAAWTSFVGQMGGLIVDQLKASDIPGWMRAQLDAIGDDVTVDGLNAALQAIATVDAAFKGWADTLTGFTGLSAEVQTALLNVSGGIDGLAGNVNTFYSGFYTEQERMATLQRQVLEQLGGLGVTVDTSTAEAAKESFRVTVEGALAAGNGELAAQLLALSGNFATAADYAAQAAETVSQAMAGLVTDRRQLEAELLQAQGDAAGYAAAMRAIAVEGFGPAEIAAYDYNEALRAQITEAERAAAATEDAASALASLRQQAAGIVQSQQQGLDSLIAGLQRKAEQASGGYVGNLWLSGSEFTQFAGFADQLSGATQALEQLQALGLGDELQGYADQIGAIVQGTKEALAGALSSQRLMAGDGVGALAAAISANLVQYADFSQAGAFNAATATQRAQAASGLVSDASANALSIPGIAGVLGGLVGEIATYSREVVLRDLRVQGAESLGPLVSGLLTGVYERLADAAQAQMISGPGLAGVMSARMQAGGAVLDMQAFGQAVEAVRGALDEGRISAAEADKALAYLNDAFGDLAPLLGDVAGQTARAAAAAVDLRNAGVASVEYYFGSLAGVVGQMDAAAAAANSPLAQTASVIGLLDSTATAFGQSAGAALEGAQAAIAGYLDAAAMAREQGAWADSWTYSNRAADAQLALGGLTAADSRVSRAQLIADAAAMASGIMTTASAAKAAEELAGKLVLGEGQSMRDLSLLVGGVGQFDNAGFYDAFTRISDALGAGTISNEQYKTLFDYATGVYKGVDSEAKATASAFERLRDSMKSFADSLLIGDKTTLSPEATMAEMQRQYAEAFKLAAGGDADAVSKYQSLANGLLDKSLYSSQAEYNVAFARTYGDARALESQGVSMLAAQSGGVVSELRALNSSLSKRVEDLEKNLTAALAQIAKNTADTVKGVRQQTQVIEEGST